MYRCLYFACILHVRCMYDTCMWRVQRMGDMRCADVVWGHLRGNVQGGQCKLEERAEILVHKD
jgi:hypothetical protein